MRIISSFRDYYDCIQSQGFDPNLVYVRERKAVGIHSFLLPRMGKNYSTELTLEQHTVGFCGKVYPVLKCGYNGKISLCFAADDIDQFIYGTENKEIIERYEETGRNRWSRFGLYKSKLPAFFTECERLKSNFSDVFIKYETSIFSINWKNEMVLNEFLKPLGFVKIMEPYTAYQEISMHWGGMAHSSKPIPEIPDKVMAEIKGFDKWSFRKPPSK